MKKFLSVCFLFALIFSLLIVPFLGSADPAGESGEPQPTPAAFQPKPLPKKGSIAVLVKGMSENQNAFAAALVSRQLLAKGYKVVDRDKLAAMRKSAAERLLREGNKEAIENLGQKYSAETTITINAQVGQSVLNKFNLYTGMSSAAVMVTISGGGVVYADTVQGKQVGYTPDEAAQKAIEAAALLAVERMTQ